MPEKDKKIRKYTLFILFVLVLMGILAIIVFGNPTKFIDKIGVRNGYIASFIVSFFGGFSAFTTFSNYSMLYLSINGGLDPYLLGLLTGISLALGDIFMFHFGSTGRTLLSGRLKRSIDRMTLFFSQKQRSRFIFPFAYVYVAFLPLPNDWLILFLASIRYPAKKMNWIIILGDMTHAMLICILISKGIISV